MFVADLEIPCGKGMLVCMTTGDIILTENVLVPRFSRDHQYHVSCYRCCQPFNYGCLITRGGLAPGVVQIQARTCSKSEFQSPGSVRPGSFDFPQGCPCTMNTFRSCPGGGERASAGVGFSHSEPFSRARAGPGPQEICCLFAGSESSLECARS